MLSTRSEDGMSDQSATQAIREIIEDEDAAWSASDAARYSRRVAPDAVFTNIFGQQFSGREAFERQHAFIFGGIYAGTRLKQTIAHLRFVTDGVVVVDTDAEVSGARVMPPGYASDDGTLKTKLLQVFVRQENGWWITSYHNVVVNPPRLP
jgi:uncharacterized protein (TIGR02246 family)